MTEKQQEQLWELRRDVDGGLQRFHFYRLVVILVLLVLVSSRYNDLATLATSLGFLTNDPDVRRLSSGLTVHAFLVRVDYSELDEVRKRRIIEKTLSTAHLAGTLDGRTDLESVRSLPFERFLIVSTPADRVVHVEFPYLGKLAFPTFVLAYGSIVVYCLVLHERLAIRRLLLLAQRAGRASTDVLEPTVLIGRYPLGHGLLGVLDNVVSLFVWIYMLWIAGNVVLRLLSPGPAIVNAIVVIALHVLATGFYFHLRRTYQTVIAEFDV